MSGPPGGLHPELIRHVDQAYSGGSWHGPSLRYVLGELDHVQALWRPHAGVHNAWTLSLHCAYWKDRVASMGRRLQGTFHGRGTNFPRLPDEPSAEAWEDDLRRLDAAHARLMDALREPPRPPTAEDVHRAFGAAAHDLYHAGQIRLLTRQRERA